MVGEDGPSTRPGKGFLDVKLIKISSEREKYRSCNLQISLDGGLCSGSGFKVEVMLNPKFMDTNHNTRGDFNYSPVPGA